MMTLGAEGAESAARVSWLAAEQFKADEIALPARLHWPQPSVRRAQGV